MSIQSIIKDVELGLRASPKPVPVPSTKILQHDLESKDFDDRFHHRSVIGKSNYVMSLTWPGIQYAAHACARLVLIPNRNIEKESIVL